MLIFQVNALSSFSFKQFLINLFFIKIYNQKSPDHLFNKCHPKNPHTPRETLVTFYSSKLVILFSRNPFQRRLLLTGTNQFLILEIQKVITLLKNILNFIRCSPNIIFNSRIQKHSNLLQVYVQISVIQDILNSNMFSRPR